MEGHLGLSAGLEVMRLGEMCEEEKRRGSKVVRKAAESG